MAQSPNKSTHWIGPYGVFVPNEVETVEAEDGWNSIHSDGWITEADVANPPSREEWLKRNTTMVRSFRGWVNIYNSTPTTNKKSLPYSITRDLHFKQ